MSEHLTHWKSMDNPDYIGAYAFQPGEEKIATIREVVTEAVSGPDGKKETKTVCYFMEPDIKKMVLNTTNRKMITKMLQSPYIEKWQGKSIVLGVENVSAFGEKVDAVRVLKKQPQVQRESPCATCGQIIAGSGKFTAKQIIQSTTNTYNRPLCWDCAREAKAAQSAVHEADEKTAREAEMQAGQEAAEEVQDGQQQ